MKIIETDWQWNGTMSLRPQTKYIVLHHAEARICTAADIDSWHKEKNWSGIGYHYFIRKNGDIYRGRPQWAIGAQVLGANSYTLGICAEGDYQDYDTEMPAAQKQAFKELIIYLKTEFFPDAEIKGHKEVGDSNCPGKFFPLAELESYPFGIEKVKSPYDLAFDALAARGALSDDYWRDYYNYVHVAQALTAIDNGTGGEWYSDEDDTAIHWAQPKVISLCGKSVICDKDQWLNNLDQYISKALVLALCDNITGGMLDKYKGADVDHWGRRNLNSLCDKSIVTTPSAWADDFEGCVGRGNFMCILEKCLNYGN